MTKSPILEPIRVGDNPLTYATGNGKVQTTGTSQPIEKKIKKIYCDHCGYSKDCDWLAGGADDIGSLYGHHNCPDGEMGMLRDAPSPIVSDKLKEKK